MTPGPATAGIHHVTAIASDPQRNVRFYTGVLGLRLVKVTVNFDDPRAYHLYYGDETGRPGTILTFFAWPDARTVRPGIGQATAVSFAVPPGSLAEWAGRLARHGIDVDGPAGPEGAGRLAFADPDGTGLELAVDEEAAGRDPWSEGDVDPEIAVRGFHDVTLTVQGYEATAAVLRDGLGFEDGGREANRCPFHAGRPGEPGRRVRLECAPDGLPGRVGAGTIHHVAFRAADDDAQQTMRERLLERGLDVTPVLERRYFRSIYFREPGGGLFEIATDAPGFTADEPAGALGTTLRLPPWLEPMRERIEAVLPPIRVPGGHTIPAP